MPLIDFTLSNARQFYSSMGNPTGLKGLNATIQNMTIILDYYIATIIIIIIQQLLFNVNQVILLSEVLN